MIGQSEIKRIAATTGVALNVVEHDYALGCFLHMLASSEQVRSSWAFKGGTALAKCYFENYRFSEDLDFTITQSISLPEIASIVNASKARMQSEIGIATDVRDIVIDQIGFMDESFFLFYNDVDFCYRIKQAGWKIYFYAEAKIFHSKGASTGQVKIKKIILSHWGHFLYLKKYHSSGLKAILLLPFGLGLFFTSVLRIIFNFLKKSSSTKK